MPKNAYLCRRIKESKMNKNLILALIAVPCLLASCGQKKQHDDIIVQQTETPKPQSPIRMQDYKDVKDVQWLGKQYQVEVSRTADDSLRMVKDENGQKFVDNRITLKIIRADGSEFCSKSFTKAAFEGCLDDDYRKTGILEGFVFDKAEGNQLFFAASVCHPQTDEYIPLVVRLSRMGELSVRRDTRLDTSANDSIDD